MPAERKNGRKAHEDLHPRVSGKINRPKASGKAQGRAGRSEKLPTEIPKRPFLIWKDTLVGAGGIGEFFLCSGPSDEGLDFGKIYHR